MKTEREQIMQDYNQDAEAFKGCLFLLVIIGAAITTLITIIIIN